MAKNLKSLGIIPARYASSRLPGKPLVKLGGKPMIQQVYERARAGVEDLLVATDDKRIEEVVRGFGGQVVMTDPGHSTGTNRCLEAYDAWAQGGRRAEVIVNIQGDEPLVDARDLSLLIELFEEEDVELGTLVKALTSTEELYNRTGCFVVLNTRDEALYFSRALLPVVRDHPVEEWMEHHTFYKHLGMYAYRPEVLRKFAALPISPLEGAEHLEQNRWLEYGGTIRVARTPRESWSVDTPEDLAYLRKQIEKS